MINRLKLYTQDLAVIDNEDFSIPLSRKNIVADLLQNVQHVACGALVELVDTQVLGTCIARCGSSSLFWPTKTRKKSSFKISNKSYQRIVNWLNRRVSLSLGSSAVRCEGSSPFRPTIRFDEL